MDKDQLERAKIAMEEYKVLHAEILQRNNVLIRIIAGGIAAIVAAIGFWANKNLSSYATIWLIVMILGVLGVAWKMVDSDARNAAKRIIEIEEYVNQAVGGDDRNPLSWERRFGLLARSYLDRFKKFDFDTR